MHPFLLRETTCLLEKVLPSIRKKRNMTLVLVTNSSKASINLAKHVICSVRLFIICGAIHSVDFYIALPYPFVSICVCFCVGVFYSFLSFRFDYLNMVWSVWGYLHVLYYYFHTYTICIKYNNCILSLQFSSRSTQPVHMDQMKNHNKVRKDKQNYFEAPFN